MRFVPVPITGGPSEGKTIRFSIWETRVKDYAAFVEDTKRELKKAGFPQGDDHPAVRVTWDDAKTFCAWLTVAEQKRRKIGAKDVYRLPTDHEWSCAVGIGKDEDAAAPIRSLHMKVAGYPWGESFPPQKKEGNYYGEECKRNPMGDEPGISGYDDGFDRTSPVGKFTANGFGLFDLGGNTWEWCADWWDSAQTFRVLRGACWSSRESMLMSSYRGFRPPSTGDFGQGFRVVLEVGTPAPQP